MHQSRIKKTKKGMTQAERSNKTRSAVCEATLDTLVEFGHDRISTNLIARRAKISRGAITHQFPTRQDLLVSAYQYLIDQWRALPPFGLNPEMNRMSVDELIDSLWNNLFSTKHYIAAIVLMLAAREDNELGRALRGVLESWIQDRDKVAVQLVGGDTHNDEAMLRIQLHLSVLRGIAIHRSFDTDIGTADRLIALWKRLGSRPIDSA